MKKFNRSLYCVDCNEDPFPIIQPTLLGFELIIQYLKQKYESNIFRENVKFYTLDDVKENIRLFMNQVESARKNVGDYRFSWIPGTSHAVSLVWLRENGAEAIFYTDSNRAPSDTIPNFAEELSTLTGLTVYATSGNRQADLRSCYTDALVFARDITGRDTTTGEYRIPNFLSFLQARIKELDISPFDARLPDELLKSAQISSFIRKHKEPNSHVIHKNETLDIFRKRYSKNIPRNGENKLVSTYLVEKGLKYSHIMQIQFYLNQMPYLTKTQIKAFVKDAKSILTSDPDHLHDFSVQRATELGHPPEPSINIFVRAALAENNESTILHEIVASQPLNQLQIFYGLIPREFYLRVLTSPDKSGNTVLHWATSQDPEKFKYLFNSLTEEEKVEALTAPGEKKSTVVHWLSGYPAKIDLLDFVLQSLHSTQLLKVLTTPGENDNTPLHWLEKQPEPLARVLQRLPENQRLEAITVAGQDGASLLHWIHTKPASKEAVLNCLSDLERTAIEEVLMNGLPTSCAELREQLQDKINISIKNSSTVVVQPLALSKGRNHSFIFNCLSALALLAGGALMIVGLVMLNPILMGVGVGVVATVVVVSEILSQTGIFSKKTSENDNDENLGALPDSGVSS